MMRVESGGVARPANHPRNAPRAGSCQIVTGVVMVINKVTVVLVAHTPFRAFINL